MPKILVATPLEPSKIGGVERMVLEFIERHSPSDNVAVVCGGKSCRVNSVKDVPIYVVPAKFGSFSYAPQAMEIVKSVSPDIIYAHDYSSYMPYLAFKYKKNFPKTRFVFHTHFHPKGSSFMANLLRRFYDPIVGKRELNFADAIICNAEAERRFLKRIGVTSPIYIVYNGIDVESIQKAKPYPIKEKALLYVGRLERYKNVQIAIRMMNYLSSDFHLFVVGTGPFEDNLKKLSHSLSLDKRVHFLGLLNDLDLYRWYQTSSCLIHLSDFESFGRTCIEALAAGTPVIANDDKYGLSEKIDLFPNYVLRFSKTEENYKKLSELVEYAVGLKPVNVNLSAYMWNTIGPQIESILKQP